jgi:hypothetical protein
MGEGGENGKGGGMFVLLHKNKCFQIALSEKFDIFQMGLSQSAK